MLSYAIQEQPNQTDQFLSLQVQLIAQQVTGRVLLLSQRADWLNQQARAQGQPHAPSQSSEQSQAALGPWELLVAEPNEAGLLQQVSEYLGEYLNEYLNLATANLGPMSRAGTSQLALFIEKIANVQGDNLFACCFASSGWHCLLLLTPLELTLSQQGLIFTCIRALQEYQRLEAAYQKTTAKIEVFEETLHRIGHSLRHPLGLINVLTECWRRDSANPSAQEPAQTIQQVVRHLDQELSELINLGRFPVERQSLLLLDLCQGILQRSQPYLEAKQLNVICADTPVTVLGDRQQLQLLLENLLSNAIYFSPVGGTISIQWQAFCQEVVLTIADQGPGFSAEDLQNLFKPFYTRRENGIGLGMVIARKIVLDHHGSIWAQNCLRNNCLTKGLPTKSLPTKDPQIKNLQVTGAEVVVILPS